MDNREISPRENEHEWYREKHHSIRRRSGEHPCPPFAFPTRGSGSARAATADSGLLPASRRPRCIREQPGGREPLGWVESRKTVAGRAQTPERTEFPSSGTAYPTATPQSPPGWHQLPAAGVPQRTRWLLAQDGRYLPGPIAPGCPAPFLPPPAPAAQTSQHP